jgi:hypothetical protein
MVLRNPILASRAKGKGDAVGRDLDYRGSHI